MDKKYKILLIVLGILIVAYFSLNLAGVNLGPLSTITFEEGWEPYGESNNQVTGLTEKNVSDDLITRDSKYWTFEKTKGSIYGFIDDDYPDPRGLSVGGSDLNMEVGIDKLTLKITTKEDFSNKDFKAEIEVLNCNDYRQYNRHCYISAKGVSQKPMYNGNTFKYKITSSPVSNTYTVYWNGIKQGTFKAEKYNPFITISGSSTHHAYFSNPKIEIAASWREQFGCTKKPDEQYYVKVFKSGDTVTKDDFSYWNKFCLSQPVTIYTPEGSTSTKEPLLQMIEDEDYSQKIPPGQIWTIQYIGKLQDPQTPCEKGEVYDLQNEKCLARTQVNWYFLSEEEKINVTTKPVEYNQIDIETHKDLEKLSKFGFVHKKDSKGGETNNFFSIGSKTFISSKPKYMGPDVDDISYSDNPDYWEFSFNYGEKNYSNIEKGKTYNLDNYLDVKINDIRAEYDIDRDGQGNIENKEIEGFKVDYRFEIDTSFISLDWDGENGQVIINNDYMDFPGGIIVTKTINQKTTVEDKSIPLNKGENKFDIDMENLLEIKIRPYLTIETPKYIYNLDVLQALTHTVNPEEKTICPDGFSYNSLSGYCEREPEEKIKCPEGEYDINNDICIINPGTKIRCPENFSYDSEKNVCVRQPERIIECPKGEYDESEEKCIITPGTQIICEEGIYNEDIGKCEIKPREIFGINTWIVYSLLGLLIVLLVMTQRKKLKRLLS